MNTATFDSLPLSNSIKESITSLGFSNPTPIQEQSIPLLLQKLDLLGQAQTGTGKTFAFGIPLVELVSSSKHHTQALVLCPTRELCVQIAGELQKLASFDKKLGIVSLYGGQPIDRQLKILKKQPAHIILATPGRLFDHLRRKSITLEKISCIVLDEADEMLDMGFKEDIESVLDRVPENAQRVFFSATMPKNIKTLSDNYLRDPQIIKIAPTKAAQKNITQNYLRVSPREKQNILSRLLYFHNPGRAVIFCNAKSTIEELAHQITLRGFDVGVLHGDLSQTQRDRVMAAFRSGIVKILVATDVAARGIDVQNVELVINFHLPHDPEDYIHRIGRTGRAGNTGLALSLVEPRDNSRLKKICQMTKTKIIELEPPTNSSIRYQLVNNLLGKAQNLNNSSEANVYTKLVQDNKINAQDLAANLIHLYLEKFHQFSQQEELPETKAFKSKRSNFSRPRNKSFSNNSSNKNNNFRRKRFK